MQRILPFFPLRLPGQKPVRCFNIVCNYRFICLIQRVVAQADEIEFLFPRPQAAHAFIVYLHGTAGIAAVQQQAVVAHIPREQQTVFPVQKADEPRLCRACG